MWNGNFGLWWREQDTQYPNTSQRRRWSFTGVGWKDKRYDNLERKKKNYFPHHQIWACILYQKQDGEQKEFGVASKGIIMYSIVASKPFLGWNQSLPRWVFEIFSWVGGSLLIGVFSCLLLVFFWLVSQLCYKALAPDLRLLERAGRCNDFWSAAGCFGLFTSESVWNPSL